MKKNTKAEIGEFRPFTEAVLGNVSSGALDQALHGLNGRV